MCVRALTVYQVRMHRDTSTKFSTGTAVDLNLLNLLNVVASLVLVNLILRITYLQVLLSIRVLPSI